MIPWTKTFPMFHRFHQGTYLREKSCAKPHIISYTDWKEDNLSHGCFPMSLFKNAGRLGDSGWSQTLPSTDLTQDTNHQLSSLLFRAPKYSCSHEINWLIIIIPEVNLLTSQHSQLLGLMANTWHFLCDCITTSKCYTSVISFIQTSDPVQLAMVAGAASALFVKQINDNICDTEKKESLNISLPQCVLRDWHEEDLNLQACNGYGKLWQFRSPLDDHTFW